MQALSNDIQFDPLWNPDMDDGTGDMSDSDDSGLHDGNDDSQASVSGAGCIVLSQQSVFVACALCVIRHECLEISMPCNVNFMI